MRQILRLEFALEPEGWRGNVEGEWNGVGW
jgi:hypothetical protein